MPSPEMLLQRRAMAVEEALESTYENAALVGLPTGPIEDLKAEPLLTRDQASPVLVAELAGALAAERRMQDKSAEATKK